MLDKKRPWDPPTARERQLLALAALGEDCSSDGAIPANHLTADELAELDAYIAAQTAAVRAGWSQKREAEARGVDIRVSVLGKLFEHDGRLFPCGKPENGFNERELLDLANSQN